MVRGRIGKGDKGRIGNGGQKVGLVTMSRW